mmetsp:Transcript_19178/g.39597  ORF Transcript_19178/g.39597 Transcript_19178/m.39597 type:complete len:222 (-) Transcript_19178:687-1352(-)
MVEVCLLPSLILCLLSACRKLRFLDFSVVSAISPGSVRRTVMALVFPRPRTPHLRNLVCRFLLLLSLSTLRSSLTASCSSAGSLLPLQEATLLQPTRLNGIPLVHLTLLRMVPRLLLPRLLLVSLMFSLSRFLSPIPPCLSQELSPSPSTGRPLLSLATMSQLPTWRPLLRDCALSTTLRSLATYAAALSPERTSAPTLRDIPGLSLSRLWTTLEISTPII